MPSTRRLIRWTTLALVFGLVAVAGADEASGKKDNPGSWSSAVKEIFGTAYEDYDADNRYSERSPTAPISKVWFTGAQGVLTEVYWPQMDIAQTRDSQLLVTDGRTFFHEERHDSTVKVEWVEPGVPAFHLVTSDPSGRFTIEKWIFTDPDRDAVIQHYRVKRMHEGLHFYFHHNPSAGNNPLGDSARATRAGLYAWQDQFAQAVLFSVPLRRVTAGFEETESDGYRQLSRHFDLERTYETATDGNVVLTAELDLPTAPGVSEFDVVLAFGASPEKARQVASSSLARGYASALEKYTRQWRSYAARVRDLSSAAGDGGKLFHASVAIMKSMEDKTHAGAFVAAPVVPWGEYVKDRSAVSFDKRTVHNMTAGYHLVWPRDLYEMATSFLALDDTRSAIASLNYLRSVQLTAKDGDWKFGSHAGSKEGSFAQNTWVDGRPFWEGVQLDETSMPIVLAYRLVKAGAVRAADYWDMVRRAADFVGRFGPWTPMERWEDAFGLSPSTIAAEISALWAAGEIAAKVGDADRAASYRRIAGLWNEQLEKWTFTETGCHGGRRYYERIEAAAKFDQVWDPNDDISYPLANKGGLKKEKEVTDGGFLELARFGVRHASSPYMVQTLPVYDETIRVDVKGFGPGFFRYLGDRYNYDEKTGEQTPGMLWPLLSGERGHYELARALEERREPRAAVAPYLRAIESFATPSHMIPEQVWSDGERRGRPTGAATPLGWAHGEYVKLLRSLRDGKVLDQLDVALQHAK